MAEVSEGGEGRAGRFRLPLKLKLGLLITSILALTVLVVSAVLLRQQQAALTEAMTKRGLTIAQNLAASAKSPLLTEDDLTLNLLLRDVMQDGDVAYAAITDDTGRAVAHSDVGLVGRTLERPRGLEPLAGELLVQTYRAPGQGTLIDFAVPLTFRDVRVGAIYLGFSTRAIEQALARARNNTTLIAVVMVLLGIAGAAGLAALLSRPILKLMEGTRAIAAGDFSVSLAIPSRDEIGALTAAFNRMARSLHEKEMIKRAFTRYVAREVVDVILKDPEHLVLTGERREVTVLFCDIRGFTASAEHMAPEAVVARLNAFYDLMIDTTFKHDGTLDKFLGDGVMAVFGAPIYRADHTLLAIRTALAMQAGIRELSARFQAEGKPPIAVGIGVNAGEAVAGTVGTEERMEYTVIGDSVNLAARLESAARGGQILVSEQICGKLGAAVEARPLGRLRVKGKEDEIEIYEVTAVRGGA
ncbi:MAG TPA: adenylate/guanylate cyclase domain-containing protein [Methylomirabilota bacterium]|nr:adenylate/guanylate cyclase domain-containing protein [Methylomirabilota bacterium]